MSPINFEILKKDQEYIYFLKSLKNRYNWYVEIQYESIYNLLVELSEDIENELMILNERIPDSTQIGEFLKQVNTLMERKEVDLISIHPEAIVEEKKCNRIPVRLIFQGSFVKVYQILHELETMNRTVVMEKMQITKSVGSKHCHVDLTANIFQRY